MLHTVSIVLTNCNSYPNKHHHVGSTQQTAKKSFGSLPLCLLVRLSGSYIVLAANGPHLPSLPSPALSSSSHSPANCCVFLAAPLPFLQVLSISFWVSGAHYSVSAIFVVDSCGWKEWVGSCVHVHLCTSLDDCVWVWWPCCHTVRGYVTDHRVWGEQYPCSETKQAASL